MRRYETPDSKNRWDAPLFSVSAEDELKFDEIYRSLYETKAPKPNLSTQCVSIYASWLLKGGALFRMARNEVILGNFFSKKLLSGSSPNFQDILVNIQTIKINFYGTECSIEMKIYEHVR